MAKSVSIRVEGTVERNLQSVYESYVDDPKFRNARLNEFEKTAGVSPTAGVEAIVKGAAARCRVKDCELTAQVEDEVHERGGFGMPPNEIEPSKERDVKVTLTCPRSCSRQACQGVISRATGTVERFLDEVAEGIVEPAQEAHMAPAERRAAQIRSAADAEAKSVLAAARGGLEAAGDQALADFRDRYDLAPAAAE